MILFFSLLCIIQCFQNKIYANPYNIFFLKGSRIKNEFYSPFLHQLQTQLDTHYPLQKPTVKISDYFPKTPPPNKTLLIGHSFGGFFALLQALEYPEQIKACILINSHFNQRMKMPYNPLTLDKIKQPTLLLLNHQDEQLPLSKAMDDYYVYRHPYLPNPPPYKEFRTRPGTHFSSFQNPSEIQQTIQEIIRFMETNPSSNPTPAPASAPTYTQNLKNKENILLDKLCEWQFPETRTYYHLQYFLSSKPGLFNCLYHPGNLYKTRNLHEKRMEQEIRREIHTLLASSNPQYSIAPLPEIRFKKTYLPLGEHYSHNQIFRNGLFLYSLIKWLSQEPQIYYSTAPSPHLVVELLVVPIIDDIIYYKLPNKLRFLEFYF